MLKTKKNNTFSMLIFGLILVIFNIVSVQMVLGTEKTVKSEEKIEPQLSEKMQEGDEKIPVWLWMEDIDLSYIRGLLDKDFKSIPSDRSADRLDTVRRYREWSYSRNAYKGYNTTMLSKLNLSQSDVVSVDTAAPAMILCLSKDKILDLAKIKEVIKICTYNGSLEYPNVIYQYNPDDALRVLQGLVGLRTIDSGWLYDINGDFKVDSDDALAALQSAVRLRVIEWPSNRVFPE